MNQVPFQRADFPILATKVSGTPLVYLDNAATSQKPRAVLTAEANFYEHNNANVHRGVHALSVRATKAYEAARQTVQRFIGAADSREIIFTRGTTDSLNFLADSLGSTFKPGDEIVISALEHHSNIVPWQVIAKKTGAKLIVWSLPLSLSGLKSLLNEHTKIVAIAHVSNVLGTVLPVKKIADLAHKYNAQLIVDGAQAVGHLPVDVQALDADYYVFSGHKVYGPTGIGVLYGRLRLLEHLSPYQTGGDMVATVSFTNTTYAELPARLEAGTPNVAGAVGLAAALEYINANGINTIAKHEYTLTEQARIKLSHIAGVKLVELPDGKLSAGTLSTTGIASFVVEGVHPHDLGTLLDQEGVAIRTGLLCAEPLIRALGYDAVCRASFAGYNTEADVDALVSAVQKAITKLAPKTK
ncbi:MAG: SufS family cysteine desulfurase [Candidatus Andersenbacteria bacterium]